MKFLQARHYKITERVPTLIVIHTAEIGESLDGAEALMRACASKRLNEKGEEIVSSWHYSIDADTVCQSVLDEHVAFAAPGANHNGIQIELSGRARQTPEEWQDPFSFQMILRLAEHCAFLCKKWNIPSVFVPREVLKLPGARGITTHHEVSKAFGRSVHWDPGPHFPMAALTEWTQWKMTEEKRGRDNADG